MDLASQLKFPSTTYCSSFICQQTVLGDIMVPGRAEGQSSVRPQELVHQCKWEGEVSAINIR